MKLLLVGPLPINNESLGGAKIAFLTTVNYFKASPNFDVNVINTSRQISSSSKIVRFLKNLLSGIRLISEYIHSIVGKDIIVINMSGGGVNNLAWILSKIGRINNKIVVLRVFGGNLDEKVSKGIFRCIFSRITIRNIDLLVLETKRLFDVYVGKVDVFWLPNTRDIPSSTVPREYAKKLIFLSHIRKDKGVFEILEISSHLPEDMHISIYGSLGFDISLSDLSGYSNVSYEGLVEFSAIPNILQQADLLLLPSYYDGEGYPGTIIEAFQSGMTVITTEWKSIPEVVKDGVNGLLIEPKSRKQLLSSILYLYDNDREYKRFCVNAASTGENYRTNHVYDNFAQKLMELI